MRILLVISVKKTSNSETEIRDHLIQYHKENEFIICVKSLDSSKQNWGYKSRHFSISSSHLAEKIENGLIPKFNFEKCTVSYKHKLELDPVPTFIPLKTLKGKEDEVEVDEDIQQEFMRLYSRDLLLGFLPSV